MAHKHAAIKSLRQARKAAVRNRAAREGLNRLRKQATRAAAAKKPDAAREALRLFSKAADKAVQKGILTRNAGARLKSRLTRAITRTPS